MKTGDDNTGTSRDLKTTLALTLVAMSIAAFVISGVVGILFLIQTQKDAVAGKQKIVAYRTADAVAGFIREKFSFMEAAVRLTDSDQERENAMQTLLGLEPAFRQLLFLNTKNEQLFRVSRMSATESERLDEQLGFDPLPRVSAGKRFVGSVYVDLVTSEPLVILSVPVTTILGDRLGVLLAEVNLKFIWRLVNQLQVGETGRAYVVDRKGRLIAFGDTGRVLRSETLEHLRDVSNFINHPEKEENIDVNIFIGITGEKVVGTYVPLGDPNWAVMTELSALEAYRPVIRNGVMSTIILLTMSTLAGWLGVFLARRLAMPIADLTRTATRIADGDLKVRAEMNGPTEVIRLSSAFNQMTRQLGVMLDQEVQRTRTLEREISERKRAEASLRITQFCFDHAAVGIYQTGKDGQILNVNPHAARMLGYSAEELRGLSIAEVDANLTADTFRADFKRIVGDRNRFETVHIRKDRSRIEVEVIGNLLEYDGRQFAIGFVQDITERKQAEQELHRLRKYLSNIIDSMPSVLVGVDRDGRVTLWNKQSERITGFSADQAIAKSLDTVFVQLTDKMDDIKTAIPCQESKIQQVVLNILSNGAQAMQSSSTENPQFILRTYVDSNRNMVCMEIADNGPGMDEATRKQVFDPFFTTKRKGVGTGLGLSVSYFIITDNHNGEMAVESRPGAGAKFIIRLPVQAA